MLVVEFANNCFLASETIFYQAEVRGGGHLDGAMPARERRIGGGEG